MMKAKQPIVKITLDRVDRSRLANVRDANVAQRIAKKLIASGYAVSLLI